MATGLSIANRRAKASQLLQLQGFMSLTELVGVLEVSESTVRRDLEVLEDQGLIKRTHGGAVYLKDSSTHSLAFAERETTAVAEKRAIARAVADLVPAGQTVIINGGTTCYQVAQALQGRRLSVVTNSVPIASLLSADVTTEVTLIGGYVYPRTGVAVGATAERQLEKLHATQMVLSCAGVTEDGAFNSNQMMVDVERKMMEMAEEVILAVDHSKFGRRAVARLCDLSEVDVMVTDGGVDGDSRAWLERLETKVIFVSEADSQGS